MKKIIILLCLLCTLCSCSFVERMESTTNLKVLYLSHTITDSNLMLSSAKEQLELLSESYDFNLYHEELNSVNDWIYNTKLYIEQYEPSLIIGIGNEASACFSMYEDIYPTINFVVINADCIDEDVTTIMYDSLTSSYLIGVLAATAFPNCDMFGYIGNFPDENNYSYRYGFVEGVKSINDNAEVLIDFTYSNTNSEVAKTLAISQAEQGAKFIMAAISEEANVGIYEASLTLADSEYEFYTNTMTYDLTSEDNPYIITGTTIDVETAITYVIEAYINNKLVGGNTTLKLAVGGYNLLYITKNDVNYINETVLTDSIIETVDEVYYLLLERRIVLNIDDNYTIFNE